MPAGRRLVTFVRSADKTIIDAGAAAEGDFSWVATLSPARHAVNSLRRNAH
jgi:hypothetical protein